MQATKSEAVLSFCGSRSAEEALTWGQSATLHDIRAREPEGFRTNVRQDIDVEHSTFEEVLAALRTIIETYESLRTRFVSDSTEVRQHVAATGSIGVELYPSRPEESRRVADEVGSRLQRRPFDLASDWPIRIAIVRVDNAPRHVILVMSHMAVDAWSAGLVSAHLARLTGPRPRSGRIGGTLQPTFQPVEQALHERSPGGRQASARALAYIEDRLRSVPHVVFPGRQPVPAEPRWWSGVLDSPASAFCAATLAHRYRLSRASLLLAAIALVLGYRSKADKFGCMLLVGNRFTSRARSYVGTLLQSVVTSVDLDDRPFSQFVKDVHVVALTAYSHGLSSFTDQQALTQRVEFERGINLDLGYVNYHHDFTSPAALPTTPTSDVQHLRELARYSWHEKCHHDCVSYYMRIIPDATSMKLVLFADTARLTLDEIKAVLYAIEAVLVEATLGDFRLAEAGAIAELAALEPRCGTNWVRTHGLWTSLSKTESLLRDASGVASVRVSYDESTERVVGLIASNNRSLSPLELHRLCLKSLPQHIGATTPAWYVRCAQLPTSGLSRVLPTQTDILAQGDGRG